MKAWQEEQIQSLLTCDNAPELFQRVTQLAQEIGFDYCAYGIRMPIPISAPRTEMFSNYPAAWLALYQAQNYLMTDPSITQATRTSMPFVWTEELFATSRALWKDARAHGLEYGWVQSCRDPQGTGGMLTLARSNEEMSPKELHGINQQLSWLAQTTHFGMARCLTNKLLPESQVVLSNREIAVLRWTAEGKTSGEVADILKIAERTVNFHINNAVVKLQANNKTAAAIRAAVLGLLS